MAADEVEGADATTERAIGSRGCDADDLDAGILDVDICASTAGQNASMRLPVGTAQYAQA